MDKLDYLRRWSLILKPVEELAFLRRWWNILMLAFVFGALTGWYIWVSADAPVEATARIQFEGIGRLQRDYPLRFTIISDPQNTPRKAVESLLATDAVLEKRIGATSTLSEISIHKVTTWNWKIVVLGGSFGILLAIGLIVFIQLIGEQLQQTVPPADG